MSNSIEKILVPLAKCLVILFLLSSCNSDRGHVGVSALQKTHVVTGEDVKPIVLDCDYDLASNNTSLVVKWLKENKPIYQWIKGHKPTVYPLSKGSIDENFEISPNPNFKYRAISFPEPKKELSGSYKCLVETFASTQSITIDLQVVDVRETNIQLHSMNQPNDTLVTCAVENVYPEPKLQLWTNDDVNLNKISEKVADQGNGFFNATVVFSASDVDAEDEIGCTLTFSGTEFNITKVLKSSASIKETTTATVSMLVFILVMLA